jgi:rod shape determining protein RodA
MASTRYAPGLRPSRVPGAPWRNLDVVLLASVLCMAGVGVLMVYSSTRQRQQAAGLDPEHYLKRQLLFVCIGLVSMVVAMAVDYRWLRDVAPVIWVGTFLLLMGVLTPLGASTRGTQAWYPLGPISLEPAEISKIALIIVLSAYLAVHRGDIDTPQIVTVLVLAGIPMGLIYLQPDLGSALVYVAIIMGLLLVRSEEASCRERVYVIV